MTVLLITMVLASEYYKGGMYKDYIYGAAKVVMVMMAISIAFDLTVSWIGYVL
jgi:hypothetical protein